MNWATDDLAGVIIGADLEQVGKAQGVIRAFNPDSFENTVNVRGTDLHDLPVSASGVEALTYRPGDVVIVEKWKPRSSKGMATYSIASRWLDPGQGRAEEAVAFLRGALAKQIAKQVLAEGIFSDVVLGQETTTSISFTDLPTPGPTVADVEISEVGVAIVFCNAGIGGQPQGSVNSNGGVMSFEVSGATSIAPIDDNSRSLQQGVATGGGAAHGNPLCITRSASMTVLPGLNPGLHTFQAKYKAFGSVDAVGTFNQRNLAVIAL